MAQNDYFVIVYRVLKYLYDCLKKGEKPEAEYLVASTYNIPENYWIYIVYLEKPLIIMIGGIFILILAQGGDRIARYEC